MKKALTWLSTLIKTTFYTITVYPLFVLKNIGYHLRSPSVLLYAAVFFILDRITKLMIVNNSHNLPVSVIDKFFTITFVKNPGVAFGWFPDWKLP
ncbi:MAG: signal peptidase II, partial [Candidatus Riflebacteria bacterium]|nr:signal peptidase II [Candidatus Riflebacteria bacterium]